MLRQSNISRAVVTGLAALAIIYASEVFLLKGVLTAATMQKLSVPSVVAVKGVNLPGTFIERLEDYLLLEWFPIVFITTAIVLFSIAWCLKQYFHFNDHRPFLPAISPLLFLGITMFDRIDTLKRLGQVFNYMGIAFSLIIIPATLTVVWWRHRRGIRE